MERDVSVELLEKRNPTTNQDWQHRIANFVGEPEAKAFAAKDAASHEPDAAERGPQAVVHELHEVARVELYAIPSPRQVATRQDERGFIPVRPSKPLGFETKRRLVGSRSHDIAVDRLEELFDESRLQRRPAGEFVRGLEPVDASILPSDEAVEARRHVDGHTRFSDDHRVVLISRELPGAR